MANFVLDVEGFKPFSGAIEIETPYPPLFRVKHDQEVWEVRDIYPDHRNPNLGSPGKGWLWRITVPEVYNFLGGHKTLLTKTWQMLTMALNPGMEPGNKGFRQLYDDHRAFTNDSGFDSRNWPPRDDKRDYVNGINLAGRYPFFDTSRVCGGATISGRVNGDFLEVDTWNVLEAPTLSEMLAKPWRMFRATTVSRFSTLEKEIVGNFPQNPSKGYVYVPLVTTLPVRYPMAWLVPVSKPANPYVLFV